MPDIKRSASARSEGPAEEAMVQPSAKKKGGLATKLVVIVIIIAVILVGLFLVSKYTSWNILNVNKGASTSGWQAVFLSNGQVYFGNVTKEASHTIVLEDVYYLQVTQQIQPVQEGQQQPQQNLSLVKLGNELHGPQDQMRINRAHVLFTEDLKSDSRVVDAIVRYLDDEQE